MKKIYAFILIGFIFQQTAHANDWEITKVGIANYNYVGGVIGVTISEGLHLQGVISADHTNGWFIEGFASTDALVGEADPTNSFGGEVDLSVGIRGKLAGGRLSYQADYSSFWISAPEGVKDIQNARLFLTWNGDHAVDYHASIQPFFTNDFGPGEGLAYKVGSSYRGFKLDVGGHTGLFDTDAEKVSFGQIGWSGQVKKVRVSGFLQKGFADPIDDTVSISLLYKFK